MASSAEMGAIEVSPEMLTLCGAGDVGKRRWPPRTVGFVLDEQVTVTFHEKPSEATLNREAGTNRIILLVDRSACERLLSAQLSFSNGATYLIPAELRAISLALRDCTMPPAAAEPYRLAKSIELLCEILRAFAAGEMIAVSANVLNFADYRRIAEARKLIDENWSEPLTLSQIARRCGLNRSKLSRGFRALFQCSVSEALAERRLSEARRQLISTDLPVGLIGYRSGYQNNASFSRAFCRRYGMPPSGLRTRVAAA
jgi:AraC family transcriptional activator of pyochelin receptor